VKHHHQSRREADDEVNCEVHTGDVNDVCPTDGSQSVGHVTRVSAAMLSSDVVKHDDPAVIVRRKSPVVLVPAYFRSGSADSSARQRHSAPWRQFYVAVAPLVRYAVYETGRLCNAQLDYCFDCNRFVGLRKSGC